MEITQLARKPELVEVKLDSEDIIETYGESIEFWMKDYVDITTYFDFYKAQGGENGAKLNDLLRQIILKSDGTQAMGPEDELPVDIAVAALTRINDILGKSKTKSLTSKVGNQSNS